MEDQNNSKLMNGETEPQTESKISENQERVNENSQSETREETTPNSTIDIEEVKNKTEETIEEIKKDEEPKTEEVKVEIKEELSITPEQVELHATEESIQNNQKTENEEIKASEKTKEEVKEEIKIETKLEEDIPTTSEQIESSTEENTQVIQPNVQKVENQEEIKDEKVEQKHEEEDHSKKVKGLIDKIQEEINKETNDTSLIIKYLNEIKEVEGDLKKDIEESESEEDKKLWEELGISEDSEKKKIVWEVKRLSELFTTINSKKINVHFATQKTPQEKLEDKDGLSERKDEEYIIYLNLERNNDQENLLIFWTLARELTLISNNNYDQDPLFWNHFQEQLNWIKENLIKDYQKDFGLLLNPSTFPINSLEMKELLTICYPNSDLKEGMVDNHTQTDEKLIDRTWKTIWETLIKLTSQELETSPSEEEKEKLAIKAIVEYDPTQDKEYTISVYSHPQNPFSRKIGELVTVTPLKLELESLKETKISPKEFAILSKQKKGLEVCFRELIDKEKYQEILEKIKAIK